ncbi:hypothetical protein [Myroides sp. TSA_177.3]|uniref:hypothetical protein n=1 Tax=Myroides sp. TSA_177.3 TaxID=3415650 RepID=UPI00404525F8
MSKNILNIWFFLLFIIISFLVVSYFLKVPKFLQGKGILVNENIVDFRANRDGVISFITNDNEIVNQGDVILVYNDLADYRSIMNLDSLLTKDINLSIDIQELEVIYNRLINADVSKLGEVSTSYIAFYNQLHKLFNLKRLNLTKYEISSLQTKINQNLDNKVINKKIIEEAKSRLDLVEKNFKNDSILFAQRLISVDELVYTKNNYLQMLTNYNNLYKQFNTEDNLNELLNLDQGKIIENEKLNIALEYNHTIEQYGKLIYHIQEWKKSNLMIASISGKLKYYKYWKKDDFVQKDEQLFAIINNENSHEVVVKINVEGIGKIEKGQECLIELQEYPSIDYGYLRGEVQDIIYLKHIDRENQFSTFLKLSMINQGITDIDKEINMHYTMPVNAQIIINNERLLSEIFKRVKREIGAN